MIIPGRFLLEVEYPIILRNQGFDWTDHTGQTHYVPGLKQLSPLKLTTWAPHREGQYVQSDILEQSNKIQEEAFRLWTGGEIFELTLAPGTLNEVRYPKVILTTLRPMSSTRMGEGPGCEMEFVILATPTTAATPQTKEPTVKIYEAVIVQLNPETNEPSEVVKIVPPFVAKTARAAQDKVLVDYAREIIGKDLTGIQVRVREFQATV